MHCEQTVRPLKATEEEEEAAAACAHKCTMSKQSGPAAGVIASSSIAGPSFAESTSKAHPFPFTALFTVSAIFAAE